MNEIDPNTPLWQLNISQWLELQLFVTKEKKLVNGYKGLAQLLGVSRSTAAIIKKSGDIDDAMIQYKGLILFDADEVIEILKRKTKENSNQNTNE
jgi:hypothetical protein